MQEMSPATGTYANNGTPVGRTSLTPHIVVSPARQAIEFYRSAFGAKVGDVTEMNGAVAHAELDFGCGWLTLGEPLPDLGLAAPTAGPVTYSLALYVPNVDEVTAKAVAAGAKLNSPAATFVSGDRFSSILDPFGVRWTIMTRVEDISPAEGARRVAEWARKQ